MAANIQGKQTLPSVWHPKDAGEARRMKQQWGDTAVYTAGGTLLRTQWESGLAAVPAHLIDLSGLDDMHGFAQADSDEWMIGAMTTLAQWRRHIALQAYFPLVAEATRAIAAPSIRNLATIGGNIVSSVGDALPALLVYDTILHWHDGQSEMRQPLEEWLAAAPLHSAWKERLLMRVQLPSQPSLSQTKRISAFHKIGRREAFAPSVVTVAINGQLSLDGEWRDVRIATGGGQTIPRRLEVTEQLLNGSPANAQVLADVYDSVLAYFEPKGDIFASAEYRKKTAANLIVSELWSAAKRLADER